MAAESFATNETDILCLCIEGVEKSKISYSFERVKDANKRLRVSFPDYRAKKPVRAVRMSRVSNQPFTEVPGRNIFEQVEFVHLLHLTIFP